MTNSEKILNRFKNTLLDLKIERITLQKEKVALQEKLSCVQNELHVNIGKQLTCINFINHANSKDKNHENKIYSISD